MLLRLGESRSGRIIFFHRFLGGAVLSVGNVMRWKTIFNRPRITI